MRIFTLFDEQRRFTAVVVALSEEHARDLATIRTSQYTYPQSRITREDWAVVDQGPLETGVVFVDEGD